MVQGVAERKQQLTKDAEAVKQLGFAFEWTVHMLLFSFKWLE